MSPDEATPRDVLAGRPTAHPDVSVVLPVYRNAATLRELHRRLTRTLQAWPGGYEIIFVDDACPEDSFSILRTIAEHDPCVGVVGLAQNVGQQQAVLVGLGTARGRRVVAMDADLQDAPEVIPLLLRALEGGHAAVFAGRHGRYESPLRLLSARMFRTLLRLLCGIPTDAGLFVVMNREMVDYLLSLPEPRPFIVAMMGWSRLGLAAIPVRRAPRLQGRSAYTSLDRLGIGCQAILRTVAWRLGGREPVARGRYPRPVAIRAHLAAHRVSARSVSPAEAHGGTT